MNDSISEDKPKPDLTDPKVVSPKSTKTPNSKTDSSKSKLRIAIAILIVIVTVAGAALAIGWILMNRESKEEKSQQTESETQIQEAEETAPKDMEEEYRDDDEALFGPRKIAYMKSHNIWVMETDGSNKTQVTMDGDGDATRYTAMNWKDRGILGYAKCDGSCNVYTYDLSTGGVEAVHTPPPFTQTVAEISWSHDGESLGVIYTKADYSYEAYITTGGSATTIATFGAPPARGGGYADGISIEFSPDDTKVVILNTVVGFGDDTIVAAEVDGTPITTLSEATHPSFDGNTGFYFIADGKIKKYTFSTDAIENVLNLGSDGGYNLDTSPDRNFIAFWNENSSGDTRLYFHDVAGSPALIANNFANPQWLDNSTLVAIKTIAGMGMGYESIGLSKVERVGGAETVIEVDNVYNFEIEPL